MRGEMILAREEEEEEEDRKGGWRGFGGTFSTIEITRWRRNVIETDAALPAADGTGNVVQRGREHLEIGRE